MVASFPFLTWDIMKPMKTTDFIHNKKIPDFCRRNNISSFSLFGSYSTGKSRPGSDVDILISFRPETCPTLADLAEMRGELETLFGKTVDLVEEEAIRNPYRRASILREKKILYAPRG
jgi:predicted nucleotidyltransferase